MKKKRIRRIYYLHQKMKEFGFEVDSPNRQVDVSPHHRLIDIPIGPRYYVAQLIKEGYNIQLKLL